MGSRSSYSHSGCTNCKRSSIKCDEISPSCLNCSRKGIACTYTQVIHFYQPERTKQNRIKKIKSRKNKKPEVIAGLLPAASYNSFGTKSSLHAIEESIFKLREDLNDRSTKTVLKLDILQCKETSEPYSQEDLLKVPDYVKYWKPYNRERYQELFEKLDARGDKNMEGHFHEHDPLTQELLWYTLSESKCAYNYLLVKDDNENCVANWFLYFGKRYSIVPFTVNAVIGNLLDVKCSDDRWFCLLQRNMTATLSNLSQRVGECDSFSEMSCYLICVMFLCSERSAARLDAWRTHLRGAFAILTKCEGLYIQKGLDNSDLTDTETRYAVEMYLWAKNWFISAETMACLSAPNGGSVDCINRLVKCLNFNECKENNGYIIGGFNLMKGYSQLLTPVFVELISFMFKFSSSEGVSLSGCEGILYDLPRNHERDLMGKRLIQKVTEIQSEQFNLLSVKDYKLRACMKACNRCFCFALKIFICSVLLGSPIYGTEIQHCVQGIEEELASIHIFKIFGLSIHWPLFIGALCAPPGQQRRTFLDAFKTIVENGTYVARNTIERVERFWNIIDRGDVIDEKDYDCIML